MICDPQYNLGFKLSLLTEIISVEILLFRMHYTIASSLDKMALLSNMYIGYLVF